MKRAIVIPSLLVLFFLFHIVNSNAAWYTNVSAAYGFENSDTRDFTTFFNGSQLGSGLTYVTGIIGSKGINATGISTSGFNVSDAGAFNPIQQQTIGMWVRTSDNSDGYLLRKGSTAQYYLYMYSNGTIEAAYQIGGSARSAKGADINNELDHCIVWHYNGANIWLVVDNTTYSNQSVTGSINTIAENITFFNDRGGSPLNGMLDNVFFSNYTTTAADDIAFCSKLEYSGAPVLTGLNCTSCSPFGFGDSDNPYSSADTTPTFAFDTNMPAYCRIGVTNVNYTSMSSSRNCTNGEGSAAGHVCSLTAQDTLASATGYVYISCTSTSGAESAASTSGALTINGIATNDGAAIDYGISISSVWPGATVYSNQQVYLRDLNNNQVLATVDRVVAYGNQRWIFNYNETGTLGLFNITPVVYCLEMINLSYDEVEYRVATFINTTRS